MKNLILLLMIGFLLTLSSCDSDVYDKEIKNEKGFAIALKMPEQDTAYNVILRVFNNEGVFIQKSNYSSVKELSSTILNFPSGNDKLLLTDNCENIFSINEEENKSTLQNLLFTLKAPSSSPIPAHYALCDISSPIDSLSHITIQMNRIFAELHLSISNIADNITKVSAKIMNVSCGFYPCIEKLTPNTTSVNLENIAVVNETVTFPKTILMPDDNPQVEIVLYKNDGNTLITRVNLPPMYNGGIYSTNINGSDLQADILLNLTQITDWRQNKEINGEILNPIIQ